MIVKELTIVTTWLVGRLHRRKLEEKIDRLTEENRALAEENRRLIRLNKDNEDEKGQKGHRISRRIFMVMTASIPLATPFVAWWLGSPPSTPDLRVRAAVFGARNDDSNGPVPGGIKFTIKNDGNGVALLTKVRIEIEDYDQLKIWAEPEGIGAATFCDDTFSLPPDVKPGTTYDRNFDFEIKANDTDAFNELIVFGKITADNSPDSLNILAAHIYRLHVTLIRDDGTAYDAGRVAIFLTENNGGLENIEHYWIPASTRFSNNTDNSWNTREESLREWYSQRIDNADELESTVTHHLADINDNEEKLRRVITQDSKVIASSKMEAIRKALDSGELDLTQIDGTVVANFVCPSPSPSASSS